VKIIFPKNTGENETGKRIYSIRGFRPAIVGCGDFHFAKNIETPKEVV
jgi:hypothetical protein